jgi:hypothetical protein
MRHCRATSSRVAITTSSVVSQEWQRMKQSFGMWPSAEWYSAKCCSGNWRSIEWHWNTTQQNDPKNNEKQQNVQGRMKALQNATQQNDIQQSLFDQCMKITLVKRYKCSIHWGVILSNALAPGYNFTPLGWLLRIYPLICRKTSIRGLYYKHITIVSDDRKWRHNLEHRSRPILETSFTAFLIQVIVVTIVNYNGNTFIVQVTVLTFFWNL